MSKAAKVIQPVPVFPANAQQQATAYVHVPYAVTRDGKAVIVPVVVALSDVTDEEFLAAARMVREQAAKLIQ